MSQSGRLGVSNSPTGNVTSLSDNDGVKTFPDGSGNIAVFGPKSAYTRSGVNQLNIYGSASYLVDADGFAPYTTISAAITAAVTDGASSTSQKNIVIKPGTYTGNFSVPDGINLIAWDQTVTQKILTPTSTLRNCSVKIVGSITVSSASAQVKFIGIEVAPPSGVAAFIIGNLQQVQISRSTAIVIDAPVFSITDVNSTIICENFNSLFGTGSTTDQLYSGNGSVSAIMTFENSYIVTGLNGSGGVAGNFYFFNTYSDSTYDFSSVSILSSVTAYNSQLITSDTGVVISGGANPDLQVNLNNSVLSTNGATVFSSSSASSYIHAYNSQIVGAFSLTTTDIILDATTQQISTNLYLWNQSKTTNSQIVAQNTGTLGSNLSSLAAAGGGDSYLKVGITGTRGYALGADNSDSDKLKLQTTNSTTIDPSTGTNVFTFDPSASTFIYNALLGASAGFQQNVTAPGGYPYNIQPTDVIISVDTSAARSIILPVPILTGQTFYVKDATGTAGTNTISVTATGGLTIDGIITYAMSTNFEFRGFYYNGSAWSVM